MNSDATKISLTGIKPTGEPHLGNLVGAIRPALRLAETNNALYFIADYHALTTVRDSDRIRRSTRSVAATWIAAGLDPERATLYRQSDVPETFELTWVLACVSAKGLMNRAHAYKAARGENAAGGNSDLDAGINMGLFNYPILMAADILLMAADVVPVGKDQSQHVEYAADIATSFNHLFGGRFSLKVPKLVLPADDAGKTLPGLDGRKMSKSYGNTIPLFTSEAELRKLVRRITTNSAPAGQPNDPESAIPFLLLEQFASPDVTAAARQDLETGGRWGDLKDLLFETLNTQLGPFRERYEELIAAGSDLDGILADGARRARHRASQVLPQVRRAVGI